MSLSSPFPIIGQYPPSVVLEEDSSVLDALIAFNVSGVRFGVVVDQERRLRGLMSIKRIVAFMAGVGEYSKYVEEHGSVYRAAEKTRVSEIMRRDPPYVVLGKYGIEDVIDRMVEHRLGAVPVVLENGVVVGIVTERHLTSIIQVAPMHVAVHEVMTANPVTAAPDTSIGEAMRVLGEKWIRHLPLTDEEEKPKHLLIARDVVSYLSEEAVLEKLRRGREEEVYKTLASEVATEAVVTVKPHEDLSRALRKMKARGLSSLLVVDEQGRLEGIVTERDIVVRLPTKLGLEPFYDTVRSTIVFARPFF